MASHDDDCYRRQNADHHVRLVWANAPGVICLLPPRHQPDEDQVNQGQVHDDDGQQGEFSDQTPCLVKIMISSQAQYSAHPGNPT